MNWRRFGAWGDTHPTEGWTWVLTGVYIPAFSYLLLKGLHFVIIWHNMSNTSLKGFKFRKCPIIIGESSSFLNQWVCKELELKGAKLWGQGFHSQFPTARLKIGFNHKLLSQIPSFTSIIVRLLVIKVLQMKNCFFM